MVELNLTVFMCQSRMLRNQQAATPYFTYLCISDLQPKL